MPFYTWWYSAQPSYCHSVQSRSPWKETTCGTMTIGLAITPVLVVTTSPSCLILLNLMGTASKSHIEIVSIPGGLQGYHFMGCNDTQPTSQTRYHKPLQFDRSSRSLTWSHCKYVWRILLEWNAQSTPFILYYMFLVLSNQCLWTPRRLPSPTRLLDHSAMIIAVIPHALSMKPTIIDSIEHVISSSYYYIIYVPTRFGCSFSWYLTLYAYLR